MGDIKDWIRNNLRAGYSKEKIKQALIESGYDPNLIDEVEKEGLLIGRSNVKLMVGSEKTLIISLIALLATVSLVAYSAILLNDLNGKVDRMQKGRLRVNLELDILNNKTTLLIGKVNNLINKTNDLTALIKK